MQIIYKNEILSILPYGKDFLFIDEGKLLNGGKKMETFKTYNVSDPIIASHFKNGPSIVPGVLLIEQICQTALLLGTMSKTFPNPEHAYLGRIKSSFPCPANAPCRIKVVVSFERVVGNIVAFNGTAYIGLQKIALVEAISANAETNKT